MSAEPDHTPRLITNLKHGEHVESPAVPHVIPRKHGHGHTGPVTWADVEQVSTPFGWLFDDLRGLYPEAHLPVHESEAVVASLKALGTAMAEQPQDGVAADSTIPPIYTYWGQFVDHDLTANTDRDVDVSITELPFTPIQPEKVARDLRNLRQPQLNLDSVYGNGPALSRHPGQVPFDGDRLRLGPLAENQVGQPALPGDDLRRVDSKPLIGDSRNDENLIVAQLHVAFLKFHNAVLDWFAANPASHVTGDGGFERARELVRLHYQWITVHDFLKRVCDPADVDGLLDGSIPPRFSPAGPDKVFMPLEFSIAAFRFGHSMVRAEYDWNANFGAPGDVLPSAPFDLLFTFTGGGGFFGAETLPDNWPAQFERLTGHAPRPAGTPDAVPVRFARKIDTHLAPPLGVLRNEGTTETSLRIQRIVKRLAVRNLLRGYLLALPTGQAVAGSLGVPALTPDELLSGGPVPTAVDDALVDGGFLTATPLWFYVLREAEVKAGGERLGPVGSRIVAETVVGQVRADPTSFLNTGWDPTQGVTTGPASTDVVDSIVTFLRFAGMHP